MNEEISLEQALNDVSIGTVAAIERIEMEAWADYYAAAPAAFAREVGLSATRVNDFALFAMKNSSITLFNRSLGMGVARAVDKAALDEATTWLRNHCGPAWAVPLAAGALPAELPAWLAEKGLTLATPGIAKFWRLATRPAEGARCPYDIRLVAPAQAADFGITAQQGFEMEEGFDTWLAALCGRPRWRTYVAYDGATPAGVGAMFVKDGLAWFGMGATLPAYRGRGVQSALLARRIGEAVALGATMMSIDTSHAGLGEPPNASHRNVIRAGFSLAYFRPQYVTQ
ncbi:MAG: GNAT family N-acetyltransferase [Pararobbsia sp.]